VLASHTELEDVSKTRLAVYEAASGGTPGQIYENNVKRMLKDFVKKLNRKPQVIINFKFSL
jgi:hypothetical protein